jgi:hypothetical protein
MSKALHLIYDEVGPVGSQLASTKARAIYLWASKNTEGNEAGLRAFEMASDELPGDWEPEAPEAWKQSDDKLMAARR